jgi:hypothetical protein
MSIDFIKNPEVIPMSFGNMSTIGVWFVGKELVYFEKGIKSTKEIRKKVEEARKNPINVDGKKIHCSGDCCVDQLRIIN